MSDAKPITNWEDQMKDDEELSKSFMSTPIQHVVTGSSLALLLYAFYPSSDMPNQASKLLKFLHLGAFATVFGTQMWTTLVGGFVMFRSMPRHLFGHVQSRMFPAYSNVSTAANAIALATYLFVHPRGTWCCSGKPKVIALSVAVASSLLSSYCVSPTVTSVMRDMHKEEKKIGSSGMEIGLRYPDGKDHPEFGKLHRRFQILHSIISVVNLSSMAGNWVYLYYLASSAHI